MVSTKLCGFQSYYSRFRHMCAVRKFVVNFNSQLVPNSLLQVCSGYTVIRRRYVQGFRHFTSKATHLGRRNVKVNTFRKAKRQSHSVSQAGATKVKRSGIRQAKGCHRGEASHSVVPEAGGCHKGEVSKRLAGQ